MKVLDLFCGLKGWTQAFEYRGHEVISIDIEKKFNPTICMDINELTADYLKNRYGKFDVILASPPCQCFSVSTIYRHWIGNKKIPLKPKTDKARDSIKLVQHTLKLIDDMNPKFWILENPRCVLRRLIGLPKGTITYCQYGENRMKPTDMWGNIPTGFMFRKCKNNSKCHERASRGSKTGTQGLKNAEIRGKIPYQVSLEMCIACEKEIRGD